MESRIHRFLRIYADALGNAAGAAVLVLLGVLLGVGLFGN